MLLTWIKYWLFLNVFFIIKFIRLLFLCFGAFQFFMYCVFKQFSHLKNHDFCQIFIINNLLSFIHCCHWCPLFEILIVWFLIEANFQTFDFLAFKINLEASDH
jgi:hypothetical protein